MVAIMVGLRGRSYPESRIAQCLIWNAYGSWSAMLVLRLLGQPGTKSVRAQIDFGRCRGDDPDTKKGLMHDLLRGRLATDAGWMFLGQGVSFAVQACYFILLARLLGAHQYGIFVGAAAAVSLLSQYSCSGQAWSGPPGKPP